MQIRENLLRVIFMLSTIVVVTDCCSSRILLLKEHTLQIVNEQRFQGDDYDYDQLHDDYDQLQQQQQQQQQQHQQQQQNQLKIAQHLIIASNVELNKNYSDAQTRSRNPDDPGGETNQEQPALEISLGIFKAANYETTPSSDTTATTGGDQVTKSAPDPAMHVVDIMSHPCSGQYYTDFCLNRGRCFRYLVGNDTLHSCVCADGYVGERCESKALNGAFVPAIAGANKQHKIMMARIVFSFPMLVALSVIYIMIGAAIVFRRAPKQRTAGPLAAQERLLLDSGYTD